MAEIKVEAGLRQLSECLREIKSLLAWQELVEAETRPGTPPSFRISDHTAQDLVNKCGQFFQTAMDLRDVLNAADSRVGSRESRTRWKSRLLRAEAEFRKLNLGDRFIKA